MRLFEFIRILAAKVRLRVMVVGMPSTDVLHLNQCSQREHLQRLFP
jgi:hypothetical protein